MVCLACLTSGLCRADFSVVCEAGVSWAAQGHMLTQFPLSRVCFCLWTFGLSLHSDYYHSKGNPESWRTSLVAKTVESLSTVWETGFSPWGGMIPWRRAWQPTPVFLPGESHGHRSLTGYSPGVAKSRTQLSDLTLRAGRLSFSKIT